MKEKKQADRKDMTEKCRIETREGGQKMNKIMKRTKDWIITVFTGCNIFFMQLLHSTAEVLRQCLIS